MVRWRKHGYRIHPAHPKYPTYQQVQSALVTLQKIPALPFRPKKHTFNFLFMPVLRRSHFLYVTDTFFHDYLEKFSENFNLCHIVYNGDD